MYSEQILKEIKKTEKALLKEITTLEEYQMVRGCTTKEQIQTVLARHKEIFQPDLMGRSPLELFNEDASRDAFLITLGVLQGVKDNPKRKKLLSKVHRREFKKMHRTVFRTMIFLELLHKGAGYLELLEGPTDAEAKPEAAPN